MDLNELREKIIQHNLNFPYDRVWRKKYNVPYSSTLHKEISFLDQIFDIEEDRLFNELSEEQPYIPNTGNWLKQQKTTSDSIEDAIAEFRDEFKDIE